MSYGDNAGLEAHWTARGYDFSALDTASKTALRTKATVFVDGLGWRQTPSGAYVSRFPGHPTSPSQAAAWPRTEAADVYGRDLPDDEVPQAVLAATYEAAWYEHETPGGLNSASQSDKTVMSETVGPISVSYGVAQVAAGASRVSIPAVETLLAPVLVGGANPYGITGVVA